MDPENKKYGLRDSTYIHVKKKMDRHVEIRQNFNTVNAKGHIRPGVEEPKPAERDDGSIISCKVVDDDSSVILSAVISQQHIADHERRHYAGRRLSAATANVNLQTAWSALSGYRAHQPLTASCGYRRPGDDRIFPYFGKRQHHLFDNSGFHDKLADLAQ